MDRHQTLADLRVGKITKRCEVLLTTADSDINDAINKRLQALSHLYEFHVEDIIINKPSDPMFKTSASILYSYIGVLDDLSDYMNDWVREFNIPINKNTLVKVHDNPAICNIPLEECLFQMKYIPKAGDILVLREDI